MGMRGGGKETKDSNSERNQVGSKTYKDVVLENIVWPSSPEP